MTTERHRGDLLMRIGGWITAVGLLFTVIAILPLLMPSLELPSWLWFAAMLTGVGLIVLFVGLARSAGSRRSRS